MEVNKGAFNKMVVFDMDNTILRGRFIDDCAERFNFKQALNLLRQIDHDPVSLTIRIASFLKRQNKIGVAGSSSRYAAGGRYR